jgi:hypothetical protein
MCTALWDRPIAAANVGLKPTILIPPLTAVGRSETHACLVTVVPCESIQNGLRSPLAWRLQVNIVILKLASECFNHFRGVVVPISCNDDLLASRVDVKAQAS